MCCFILVQLLQEPPTPASATLLSVTNEWQKRGRHVFPFLFLFKKTFDKPHLSKVYCFVCLFHLFLFALFSVLSNRYVS